MLLKLGTVGVLTRLLPVDGQDHPILYIPPSQSTWRRLADSDHASNKMEHMELRCRYRLRGRTVILTWSGVELMLAESTLRIEAVETENKEHPCGAA